MSEDEITKVANHEDETDEVEGHATGRRANEEAPAEGDDDVEAHVKGAKHPKRL
jgi:hypothetical protein